MIEVPVQDAGKSQLRGVLQIQLHGATGQPQALGDLHHGREPCALERNGISLPQCPQIGAQAVVAGDHAEAGQAAFGGLGLQDQWQLTAEAE